MRYNIFILFLVVSVSGFAQVNNITFKEDKSPDPNEQFINGISTREDVGGISIDEVIVERKNLDVKGNGRKIIDVSSIEYLRVTNYNSFPVSVIIKVSGDSDCYIWYHLTERQGMSGPLKFNNKIFTISLPAAKDNVYPEKLVNLVGPTDNFGLRRISDLVTITRKLGN